MLIDDEGNFLTQRTRPILSLFKVTLGLDSLTITHRNHSMRLSLLAPPIDVLIEAKIWDDVVNVNEVSGNCSDWFSERLGLKCKLVSFPEENPRPVDPDYAVNNEQVSLADAYPFLIIGQASLEDLNKRLKQPLPMNRFRPNLVFRGGNAFEEDSWTNFRIGKNRFVGVKPCGRCAVTTVNQETAEKGAEPLATLATYRKRDGQVYFGQNAIAIDHKEILESDEIILE